MPADGKIAALRTVGLFSGCTERELSDIARLSTKVEVEAGTVLTSQGEPGAECFVIAEGEAEVVIDGKVVARSGAGDTVGEMSLLDGGHRTATVRAATPMTLYVLSSAEFRAMLATSPTISLKIMYALAARLRNLEASPLH